MLTNKQEAKLLAVFRDACAEHCPEVVLTPDTEEAFLKVMSEYAAEQRQKKEGA